MQSLPISILGIPVDNLTLEETIVLIFKEIEDYKQDKRLRQIATVNVDFLVNTLGWHNKKIRHPELLDILRQASIVTADGMPLVWLSKLLGTPLKERVTGSDLVPALIAHANHTGHRFYFLGGRGDIAEQAAKVLKEKYPDINIVECSSPFVYTEGQGFITSEEEDSVIVEQINQAKVDILLVGFGNPKQEIWINRNRDQLQVPIAIGIGGTYEFIAGTISRAPEWMQKSGLEWIYRISQQPKRLFKRYFIGLIKLAILTLPLLITHMQRKWFMQKIDQPDITISSSHSGLLYHIIVPKRADAAWAESIKAILEKEKLYQQNLLFDFQETNFMDSSALGFLIRTWRETKSNQSKIYFFNLHNENLIALFKVSRVWDFLTEHQFENLETVIEDIKTQKTFFILVTHQETYNKITLYGRLDAEQSRSITLSALKTELKHPNTITDLSQLRFIDSTGLRLLIDLKRQLGNNPNKLVFCNPSENIYQLLKLTRLLDYLEVYVHGNVQEIFKE